MGCDGDRGSSLATPTGERRRTKMQEVLKTEKGEFSRKSLYISR